MLPNILTITRLLIAPVLLVMIIDHGEQLPLSIALLFIGGALTDFFDGKLARKYGNQTKFGKFMDPIADKALFLAGAIGLYFVNLLPLWIIIVILTRDIIITLIRKWLEVPEKSFAQIFAKVKTFIQLTIISFLLMLPYLATDIFDVELTKIQYFRVRFFSSITLLILNLGSAVLYLRHLKKNPIKEILNSKGLKSI